MISEQVSIDGSDVELIWVPGGAIDADYNPCSPSATCNVTQVSGFVIARDGRILLMRGADMGLGLPGGKPEVRETPLDTLQREVFEETYVEIAMSPIPALVGGLLWRTSETVVAWQLRYAALGRRVLSFLGEYESIGRDWVTWDRLPSVLAYGGDVTDEMIATARAIGHDLEVERATED